MADLRELKAIERRKKIRRMIRQGKTQTEMAEILDVDVTTISADVAQIAEENSKSLIANKGLIERDIEATLQAINKLDEIDNECWEIYYQTYKTKKKSPLGTDHLVEEEQDPKIKLSALETIKDNLKTRSQLLKLLTPQQITIEKMLYIEQKVPNILQKYTEIVLEYIDKDKHIELLERLKGLNIDN